MMSSAQESADELDQIFIYPHESSDINLSNPSFCVVVDDDEPFMIPSQINQTSSQDQFSLTPEIPYYHDFPIKIESLDELNVDYDTRMLDENPDEEDYEKENLSQNVNSTQSLSIDEGVSWSLSQVYGSGSNIQLASQTDSTQGSNSDYVTCSQSSTQPLSLASQEAERWLIPNCCRKHEKYYSRLASSKKSKLGKDALKKEIILERLFEPLNDGYIKPRFSHNMLCAFAIWTDPEKKMEVSTIYRFLGDCFPYFKTAEMHWKNSLRHSLATCEWFVKSREHRTEKKGYKWTFNLYKYECLNYEIRKQEIQDVSKLYHSLANEGVLHHLINMGLVRLDLPSSALPKVTSLAYPLSDQRPVEL